MGLAAGLLVSGCASEGGLLQTGALQSPSTTAQIAAAQPKVDPACATLASQIDVLRKDGVTERVEKVSTGKSPTVKVKRESLAKMVELTKLDADYQAKCSVQSKPVQAQMPAPAAAVQAAKPVAQAAATAPGTAVPPIAKP